MAHAGQRVLRLVRVARRSVSAARCLPLSGAPRDRSQKSGREGFPATARRRSLERNAMYLPCRTLARRFSTAAAAASALCVCSCTLITNVDRDRIPTDVPPPEADSGAPATADGGAQDGGAGPAGQQDGGQRDGGASDADASPDQDAAPNQDAARADSGPNADDAGDAG